MFDPDDALLPVNRRIMVSSATQSENTTESGFILPQDFKRDADLHARVTILAAAGDCSPVFRESIGHEAIVEKTMIETLRVGGRNIDVVLENYIVALLKENKN